MKGFVVTVDGPAASGKTTVSREVAKRLKCSWISTGAFYRGLAFVALQKKISREDDEALASLCNDQIWKVQMTEAQTLVFFGDVDVTAKLQTENIGQLASEISRFAKVRANLLAAQRNCARSGTGLVAEGRDCGTVVFPEADVKFFLTASSDSRAQRRVIEHGGKVTKIKEDQNRRDQQDASRSAAPMQIAENAEVIDTTSCSIMDVVEVIEKSVRRKVRMS